MRDLCVYGSRLAGSGAEQVSGRQTERRRAILVGGGAVLRDWLNCVLHAKRQSAGAPGAARALRDDRDRRNCRSKDVDDVRGGVVRSDVDSFRPGLDRSVNRFFASSRTEAVESCRKTGAAAIRVDGA